MRCGIGLFCILVLIGLVSCDSQTVEPEVAVPGIEVRNDGNGLVGTLGAPVATGPANGSVSFHSPYPNPALNNVMLPYSVAQTAQVGVKIERLSPTPAFQQEVAAVLPGFSGRPAAFIREYPVEERLGGSYQIPWDGRDAVGQPAGPGYFRVTLTAGAEVHTMDVLLVQTEEDMLALRAAAKPVGKRP
jgi:hypothetical protein